MSNYGVLEHLRSTLGWKKNISTKRTANLSILNILFFCRNMYIPFNQHFPNSILHKIKPISALAMVQPVYSFRFIMIFNCPHMLLMIRFFSNGTDSLNIGESKHHKCILQVSWIFNTLFCMFRNVKRTLKMGFLCSLLSVSLSVARCINSFIFISSQKMIIYQWHLVYRLTLTYLGQVPYWVRPSNYTYQQSYVTWTLKQKSAYILFQFSLFTHVSKEGCA